MVGLIWKSLFGQNWGRAASQLVPNNVANISLSVPAQLREQMHCLFTDRCNWKLGSMPNFALPQWTVLKKLCGHLAIAQTVGQETQAVEFGQGKVREPSHWLLCCSQLQKPLQVVVAVQSRVLRWSAVSSYGVNSTIKTISRSPCWNWRRHCAVHFGRLIGRVLTPFLHSMPEQSGCRQIETASDIGWRFMISKAAAGGVNLLVV